MSAPSSRPDHASSDADADADADGRSIVLRAEGLTVSTTHGGAEIIQTVDLTLAKGQILGVVGESGSGKSTLAQALLGYALPGLTISAGSVTVAGYDLTGMSEAARRAVRGRVISYVPQDASTALNPGRRIGRILRELLRRRLSSADRGQIEARIGTLMSEVDLPTDRKFLRRYPHELSGGQQQRLAIAGAFGGDPAVVVMDEPTTGLDVIVQRRVLELVRRLARSQGAAVVYVSHDLDTVAELVDSVAVMYSGRIVEQGPLTTVLREPAHPYAKGLMEASPDSDRPSRLRGIAGNPPRVDQRPPGCAYQPRCPLAVAACEGALPQLLPIARDHLVRCIRSADVRPLDLDPPTIEPCTPPETGPVLEAVDLRVGYGGTEVVHGVSLQVRVGQCLALVGQSGSGKSSFARALVGLNRYSSGRILLDGKEIPAGAGQRDSSAHRRIQYIFQSPHACLNPKRTAYQSVLVARRTVLPKESAAQAREQADRALTRVGLSEALWRRYPGQLSGGERQRVAIARALACEPEFLLCDEITASLDVSVQAGIIELLRSIVSSGEVGILMITHQLPLVRSIADEVAVMYHGDVVEQHANRVLFERPRTDYVKELLQASPPALRSYLSAGSSP